MRPKHFKSSRDFALLLIMVLVNCRYADSQVLPQVDKVNCTCAGIQNGTIQIQNATPTVKILLERKDVAGGFIMLSDYSLSRLFNNLGSGVYRLTFDESGVKTPVEISIEEPNPLTFEFTPLKDSDLPTSKTSFDGKLSIELPSGTNLMDLTLYYRIDDSPNFTKLQGSRVINNLKTGQYDVYITNTNNCNSEHKSIALPVVNSLSARWISGKMCSTNLIEIEVTKLVAGETLAGKYTLGLDTQNLADPIDRGGAKIFTVPLDPMNFGTYQVTITGKAGREVSLSKTITRQACNLDCGSTPLIRPTISNRLGTMSVFLKDPLPNSGPFDFQLADGNSSPLLAHNTTTTNFPVKDLKPGLYLLSVKDNVSEARCVNIPVTVPDPVIPEKEVMRDNFYVEMGNGVFRKKAACECFLKRRKAIDVTLTIVSTAPALMAPILKEGGQQWGAVISALALNLIKSVGLNQDKKYTSIEELDGQLSGVIKLEQKLRGTFAGQWNEAAALEAETMIKKIATSYSDLNITMSPGCSKAKFERILSQMFPEALTDDEKKAILKRMQPIDKADYDNDWKK